MTGAGPDDPTASRAGDAQALPAVGAAQARSPVADAREALAVRVVDRKSVRSRRLVVWAVFGVVFGLLPVLIDGLKLANDSQLWWSTLLSTRDDLLILGVLSVGAAGEVIAASIPEE